MTILGIPTCRKFMTRQEMHPIIKTHLAQDFTAGQTMFTIEILSLIVGALESGGSSSGGQQVVLPGVGEVTIPGDHDGFSGWDIAAR